MKNLAVAYSVKKRGAKSLAPQNTEEQPESVRPMVTHSKLVEAIRAKRAAPKAEPELELPEDLLEEDFEFNEEELTEPEMSKDQKIKSRIAAIMSNLGSKDL